MKKKSNFPKIILFVLIIVIILVGISILITNWYNSSIYDPANSNTSYVEFEVKEGNTLLNILDQLQTQGLVKDENAARIYLRLQNVSPIIKVGKYTIASNVNFPELIDILDQGVYKPSLQITIKEGLRSDEIANVLNNQFSKVPEAKFSESEFLNIVNNPDNTTFNSDISTFLDDFKPKGNSLEGLIFPDTYSFNTDTDAKSVVETLVSNFKKKLDDNNINQSTLSKQTGLNSLYEVIVLASIIEKEATLGDNYALISGVFHNRLNQNYPLQSDATIVYITRKQDDTVLISDTKIDSPYNTYLHAGLPPTPINSPGITSIKAAISPEQTDYFYFLRDKNNITHYSVTYEEHQSNISKYL